MLVQATGSEPVAAHKARVVCPSCRASPLKFERETCSSLTFKLIALKSLLSLSVAYALGGGGSLLMPSAPLTLNHCFGRRQLRFRGSISRHPRPFTSRLGILGPGCGSQS